ncbi:hypothetical protein B0T14DRAFT_563854 [Immersiella caudata]|uniref:Uncharacterized protein n=1 Tax=Immersiella caudata TaxID=314043 RepID=A0AA40C203_9PEZI|nr:hypothetical protein B0T14DRAFT_563854 [Immersiella caudata]
MPFSRKNALLSVPGCETIECLLRAPNNKSRATRVVKPFDEHMKAQQRRKGLVKLGKRCTQIPGDPFGLWTPWASNVVHPRDERMPRSQTPAIVAGIDSNQQIGDMIQIAHAYDEEFTVVKDNDEELVVKFALGSKSVRLMQCRDLDVTDEEAYIQSSRARASEHSTSTQLPDPPMAPELTQLIMAKLLSARGGQPDINDLSSSNPSSSGSSGSKKSKAGPFYNLRMATLEEYWLHMSPKQREDTRRDPVRANLPVPKWHTDVFHQYALDQIAAQNVWGYVEEDVFVVVDKNHRVVFANVENLSSLLFGYSTTDLLARFLDIWFYFTPLHSPESVRHTVSVYIRKIHPELDPSKATVAHLPDAKICVAHYGTWAVTGGQNGRHICLNSDSAFTRGSSSTFSRLLFGDFCRAALDKVTGMTRLLLKPLDPEHYKDPEDFLSLFALRVNGYTQRHRDKNEVSGGLAGFCTFGDYTGGHLCITQLNLKVPHEPGACSLIRGTVLRHPVENFTGPRFFLIGTNHENVKRNAWRKLGKLPALPPTNQDNDTNWKSRKHDVKMDTTCVNERDGHFDNIQYTNRKLHDAGSLEASSPSSEADTS